MVHLSRPQAHTCSNKSCFFGVTTHVPLCRVKHQEALSLSFAYFKCCSGCHDWQLSYRLCHHVGSLALNAKAYTLQTRMSLRVSKINCQKSEGRLLMHMMWSIYHHIPIFFFILPQLLRAVCFLFSPKHWAAIGIEVSLLKQTAAAGCSLLTQD